MLRGDLSLSFSSREFYWCLIMSLVEQTKMTKLGKI